MLQCSTSFVCCYNIIIKLVTTYNKHYDRVPNNVLTSEAQRSKDHNVSVCCYKVIQSILSYWRGHHNRCTLRVSIAQRVRVVYVYQYFFLPRFHVRFLVVAKKKNSLIFHEKKLSFRLNISTIFLFTTPTFNLFHSKNIVTPSTFTNECEFNSRLGRWFFFFNFIFFLFFLRDKTIYSNHLMQIKRLGTDSKTLNVCDILADTIKIMIKNRLFSCLGK